MVSAQMCPLSNPTVALLRYFHLAAENLISLLRDILVTSTLSHPFAGITFPAKTKIITLDTIHLPLRDSSLLTDLPQPIPLVLLLISHSPLRAHHPAVWGG